jgi:fatty acid desaturase
MSTPTGRPPYPGEQPPAWGQGGWGPAGYGQPTPTGPPWGYRRPTNTLAIVSLVLAFVFAPAALVTGIVARRQIARTGEEGSGLALAAIVLGSLGTALFLALVVIWLVAVSMLAGTSFAP